MGREVGPRLARRFARAILELGGNNAGIVCPTADLDMALRAIAFGAMGTAGQRCTTLRRLFVHDSVYDQLVPRLKKAYETVSVGDPLEAGALVGPLIDKAAFDGMQKALAGAKAEGGNGDRRRRVSRTASRTPSMSARRWSRCRSRPGRSREETFAPILYVMRYRDFDARARRRTTPSAQGLSSSIFTRDLREAERFLSAPTARIAASPTSTSARRARRSAAHSAARRRPAAAARAGSDAWKAYMRRATNTVNYSRRCRWRRASPSTSIERTAPSI